MGLTQEQFDAILARPSIAKVNPISGHPGEVAQLERHIGDGALGALQIQKGSRGRFFVRVTSHRKHLLDEDNLCEKYLVDLCRYAGALSSDAPGKARIEVCQIKTGKGEQEFTRVEVFEV